MKANKIEKRLIRSVLKILKYVCLISWLKDQSVILITPPGVLIGLIS